MRLKVLQRERIEGIPVATTCPHCGHNGTFTPVGMDNIIMKDTWCGQRVCPNPKCKGHLFIVLKNGELVFQYPPVRVSFDPSDIPEDILHTFDEALTCHSQSCYVSSAIMVRRTLEEICHAQKAEGENLRDKIKDLKSKIVLPLDLLEAMDELRLLGNDAAHIEAKTYDQISKDELDVALEFTIEILKALYQLSSLLGKLRGLKKGNT